MTYFKLSSWKISTWLPPGRERRGWLRELCRAAPRRAVPPAPQTRPAFQEPSRLGMPQVANHGGCFKPAADLLAASQNVSGAGSEHPKRLTPFPRLLIPRISLSLP